MQSIFCKTASIIAHSCKSAAVLAEADAHLVEMAYTYGRHLGIAYQVWSLFPFFSLSRRHLLRFVC